MRRKVFSINTELDKVTGVQKVLLDVHRAVKDDYDAKIVGTIPYEKVNGNHGISRAEYLQLKNPFMFRNSIVFVHERKLLALFWLLNNVFFQRIKIVYIHHNVFYTHRRLSIMPKTVVAISDEGVENLMTFFKVPKCNIHKIYNCVNDIHPQQHKLYNGGCVRLLYPARINDTKRQVEIVKRLSGKLSPQVKILFAGTGGMVNDLIDVIGDSSNFDFLGFRSDIYNLISNCDYMMLFSKHEGLPISLIEATMMGLPVVCNNVGGNSEIVHNNENGFVLQKDDWDGLVTVLNGLPKITSDEYRKMSLAGRNLYENNFIFSNFKNNYLELISSL